jgi:hypothetical protein
MLKFYLGGSTGTPAILAEDFNVFSHQFFQANARLAPQLGHNCYITNPSKFSIYLLPNNLISLSTTTS